MDVPIYTIALGTPTARSRSPTRTASRRRSRSRTPRRSPRSPRRPAPSPSTRRRRPTCRPSTTTCSPAAIRREPGGHGAVRRGGPGARGRRGRPVRSGSADCLARPDGPGWRESSKRRCRLFAAPCTTSVRRHDGANESAVRARSSWLRRVRHDQSMGSETDRVPAHRAAPRGRLPAAAPMRCSNTWQPTKRSYGAVGERPRRLGRVVHDAPPLDCQVRASDRAPCTSAPTISDGGAAQLQRGLAGRGGLRSGHRPSAPPADT